MEYKISTDMSFRVKTKKTMYHHVLQFKTKTMVQMTKPNYDMTLAVMSAYRMPKCNLINVILHLTKNCNTIRCFLLFFYNPI